MSVFSKLCTDICDFGERNSNPRKDKVCRITPHHMAGVLDARRCAEMHLARGNASANYYIGPDGKICGGVSEDRRAWTSGTGNAQGSNDHTAITIEVSNSASGEPWPVSDAAYKALVKLCADICKRYGITPHFDGTTGGTITEHCQLQCTACPGTTLRGYIEGKKFEEDIKKAMGDTPTPSKSTEEQIWDYLYEHIGNAFGVAGLMGNLYAESGLRPNNLQNSFEKKLGMTDAQYTAAVDSGAYSKDAFIHDSAGYGLAQWTFWSRKENLYKYCKYRGTSIGYLTTQLDYLWEELSKGYTVTLDALKTATSVYDASTAVLTQFERPRDQSEAMKQKRASYSQLYYDKYAGGETGLPYIARIVVDELNIRSGPGTQYSVVGMVHRGSAYTIVDEQDGFGKLKSGAGWICLQYTQRV